MKTLNVKHQKKRDNLWEDEAGNKVQYSRLTKTERKQEAGSIKLLNEALKVNKQLVNLKDLVAEVCADVYQTFMQEKKIDTPGKGNFTWYNFNRSIKIEVAINERIEFDDLTITACKDKLDEFLDANVESKVDVVKDLVNHAFETSRGKLDSKKVMGLLKYRSKIKDSLFQEALNLLEESIRRPLSKTYFRVWAMNVNGEYELINLNFSAI